MDRRVILDKYNSVCIAILQYAYLLFYINKSSVFFSSDLLFIGVMLVLLFQFIIRLIYSDWYFSKCLFIAFVGTGWGILCSFINGSGLGSAMNLWGLLVSLGLFSEMGISKTGQKRIIFRMVIILSIILIVFSRLNVMHYYSSILPFHNQTIALNPNTIGILRFFCFVFIWRYINITQLNGFVKRLFYGVLVLLATTLILETDARTSMLAAFLFVIGISVFDSNRSKLLNRFFLSLLLGSLAIVLIYVILFKSGVGINDSFMDKGFYSGREVIWIEALERISDNLLFGFSNKTAFVGEFLSVHNSLLAVLCYYGLIGLVCTVAVLYMSFKQINEGYGNIAVIAICATVIIMCFETVLTDWSTLWPFCFLFIRMKNSFNCSY